MLLKQGNGLGTCPFGSVGAVRRRGQTFAKASETA